MRIFLRLLLVGGMLGALTMVDTGCTAKAKKTYHLHRADKFYTASQYEQAEIEYINALRNAPLDSHAIGRLGLIYFNDGRLQHASPYLAKASELDTNNLECRTKLGFVYAAFGKQKEARDSANYVLDRNPQEAEAPLLLADNCNLAKDINVARQKLLKLDPNFSAAPIQVALGTLSFKDHDLKTAAAYFNRALVDDPHFAAAEAATATLLWLAGDSKQADEHFHKAATLSPPRSPHRIQYAQFKMKINDTAGAKQVLEEVNQQAPDYFPALTMLAEIALSEKKWDESAAWIEKILARDPDDYEGMSLDGQLKMAEAKGDDAIAGLERMTKLYPQSARTRYELAQVYISSGDASKAEYNLNQALNINSNFVEAALLLGELQIKNRNPAPVVAAMKDLTQKQPQVVEAQMLLADAYRLQGDSADALAIYQAVEKQFPQNPQVPLLEASAYKQIKDNAQAGAAYNRVLALDPTNFPALEGLVDLDLAGRQYTTALKRIENEVQKRPQEEPLLIMLASVYKISGNVDKTESTLQQAIQNAPNDAEPYLLLSSMYHEQKQNQKAWDELNAILARAPQNISALMFIVSLQDEAKAYAEEAATMQKILTINPKFSPALNNLAYLDAEHLNKLDEAYDLAQRAREIMRNDPSTADTLGWVSLLRGSYSSALNLLQESARSLPQEPDVQFHLGMADYMMGDEEAAQTALQRALQLNPSFEHHEDCEQSLNVLAIDPQTADASALALLEKRVSSKTDDQIALGKLAVIYQHTGKTEKAISTYEALLQANPQNFNATFNLASLYAGKDFKKAYELARIAYKQFPDNTDVQQLAGSLAYQNGDYRFAYTLLQQATQAQSLSPQGRFYYAQAAYSMGDVTDAQQVLVSLAPTALLAGQAAEVQRFTNLTSLYYTPARAVDSAAQISDILNSEPNYVPALMVMGVIDEQKRETSAAVDIYEKVLATFPDFVPAERQLAIIYSHDPTKLDRGNALGSKARAAYPGDPALAKALGMIFYQQGDYSRALSQLRYAAQNAPDAETFFYLGAAQFQLKNRTESRANLERALDMKLTETEAQVARGMLGGGK